MRAFDSDLRARLRAGDADAWNGLCHELRPRVELLVTLQLDRRLRRRVDVDDVVQELLVQLLRARVDPGPGGEALLAWLREAVGHHLIDLHRRHVGAARRSLDREHRLEREDGRTPAVPSPRTTPTRAARRDERAAALRDALSRLSADHRAVIVHRLLEERSVAETATLLRRSEGATSVLLNRALRKLRDVYRGAAPTGLGR